MNDLDKSIDIKFTRKELLLIFAIVDLAFTYFTFVEQQYFSLVAMLGLLLLGLISAFLFFAGEFRDKRLERWVYAISILLSIVLIFYEVSFDLPPPNLWQIAQQSIVLVSAATIVTMVGIFLSKKSIMKMDRKDHRKIYLSIFAFAILLAVLAYFVMYITSNFQWSGVDELSFNYYASYLFMHGQNPYVQSMQPIITQNHIYPTVQRDGTFEYAYDYPALSFLMLVFMPILGITNLLPLIWIIIFAAIFTSLLLFYRSGFKKELYALIAVWIIVSYALVGVVAQYIAISIFMTVAYLERRNTLLSGVLLGLAASTIQLAWFVLPFFYALIYREHGKDAFIKSIALTAAVFILVNIYFIIQSPAATLVNMFVLFGLGSLMAYGINLAQLSIIFFPLPSWYFAALAVAVYLFSLAVFYLKPNKARLLLAVVPMYIFFLSWRNISIYGLPFIPLVFALHYCDTERNAKESAVKRGTILKTTTLLAAVFIVLAVYANYSYTKAATLQMNSVMPVIDLQQGYYGIQPSLGGLQVNMTNNGNTAENVSFLVVSRSPNNEGYMLGSTLHQLAPHQTYDYQVSFQLPLVDNSTKIAVIAFSKDYIVSKKFNLTIAIP